MPTQAPPTITSVTIKMKFPEFASVDDPTIEFAIEEAILVVGQYSKRGRDLAVMWLTAHLLAIGSLAADNGGLFVVHETIGRLSQSYRETAKDVDYGTYRSTAYGQRYLQLMRLGEPAFKVVGPRHHRQWIYSDWGFYW